MADLTPLIERLRAATGPDRRLDSFVNVLTASTTCLVVSIIGEHVGASPFWLVAGGGLAAMLWERFLCIPDAATRPQERT